MARKLRVEYAGAIYHVMNRGDRRELIFMDDADRQRFVETLGEETGSGNNFRIWMQGRIQCGPMGSGSPKRRCYCG